MSVEWQQKLTRMATKVDAAAEANFETIVPFYVKAYGLQHVLRSPQLAPILRVLSTYGVRYTQGKILPALELSLGRRWALYCRSLCQSPLPPTQKRRLFSWSGSTYPQTNPQVNLHPQCCERCKVLALCSIQIQSSLVQFKRRPPGANWCPQPLIDIIFIPASGVQVHDNSSSLTPCLKESVSLKH